MNKLTLPLALALAGLGAFASAQALDVASNAAYSDGWAAGDNGGTGFAAWTVAGSTFGSATATIGTAAVLGGNSFQLSSDFGGFNTATARRDFSSALGVGDTFSFDLLQGDPTTAVGDSSFGFDLKNSTNQNMGGVFGFFYNQFSVTPDYNLFSTGDGANVSTGLDYRATTGYTVALTVTSATGFDVAVGPIGGSPTFTTSRTFDNAGTVTGFQFFNYQAGSAASTQFNNLRVTQAVPEPMTMAVLGLGAAALLRRRRR